MGDGLTYISMRQEIHAQCRNGRLSRLLPALPGLPVRRTILIPEEVSRIVFEGGLEDAGQERIGQLRRDFDRFIAGGRVTIRDGGYRSDPAYLARLEPLAEEIWEIRSVDPKPALRVLGRFAEVDVFVALLLLPRERLGEKGDPAWQQAQRQCKALWRQIFPHYKPHSGMRACDYISSNGILLRPVRPAKRAIAGGPFLLPCVDEGEIA